MENILLSGSNTALGAFSGTVTVTHNTDSSLDVNLTAFLLDDSDKVQGDSGIVFYNQPVGPNGTAAFRPVQISGKTACHSINFDLSRCPAGITKIAVTLTQDNGIGFAAVMDLKAEVRAGGSIINLTPGLFTVEKGIVVLELYLRNGQAKVRSVWRGFQTGLEGLCKNFGVETEECSPKSDAERNVKPLESNEKKSDAFYAPETNKAVTSKAEEASTGNNISTAIPGSTSAINLQKVTGKINLVKGHKGVIIEKTPEITASVSWDSGTDYDIYALVYTKDNRQIDVATFPAEDVPPLMNFQNGAVQHMGDIGRDDWEVKTETIKIRLNDNILAVVPVAYSAQSNGTGSFYLYNVSMVIDNHKGTQVTISSVNANQDDTIYTCVPGMILNTPEGVVIKPLECYSSPDSERRPKLVRRKNGEIEVLMDEGPENEYK